jgi:diaminopimelate epimerase
MHGVGNDFLIFEPGEAEGRDLRELARRSCDRHFGVGADGILVPAPSETADLRMIYHNSDSSPSGMCGNGIRCLARYAKDREIVSGDALTIEAGTGIKKVLLYEDGSSRVGMGEPEVGEEVDLQGFTFLRVSIGNPHAIAFLGSEREVGELDLRSVGPSVERSSLFPHGTNAEFACARNEHEVRRRLGERGAGETLASGSGACATAAAALHRGLARSPVRILLDGGTMEVEREDGALYMTGPAEYVCEGELLL